MLKSIWNITVNPYEEQLMEDVTILLGKSHIYKEMFAFNVICGGKRIFGIIVVVEGQKTDEVISHGATLVVNCMKGHQVSSLTIENGRYFDVTTERIKECVTLEPSEVSVFQQILGERLKI